MDRLPQIGSIPKMQKVPIFEISDAFHLFGYNFIIIMNNETFETLHLQ